MRQMPSETLIAYGIHINNRKNMDEAVFADWALKICLTGLIIFLGFIVWNLGKESKAGKFGIAVLFLVLGLGVFGFVFKELLIKFLVLPK